MAKRRVSLMISSNHSQKCQKTIIAKQPLNNSDSLEELVRQNIERNSRRVFRVDCRDTLIVVASLAPSLLLQGSGHGCVERLPGLVCSLGLTFSLCLAIESSPCLQIHPLDFTAGLPGLKELAQERAWGLSRAGFDQHCLFLVLSVRPENNSCSETVESMWNIQGYNNYVD